jgi:hypothetical protein
MPKPSKRIEKSARPISEPRWAFSFSSWTENPKIPGNRLTISRL